MTSDDDTDERWDVQQCADYFRYSKRTFQEQVSKRDDFPKKGNDKRWSRKAIFTWLERVPREPVELGAALYRHFNAEGSLLYIGISLTFLMRTYSHSKKAHWFGEIARIEIVHYPTLRAALSAELEAIRAENPVHNLRR